MWLVREQLKKPIKCTSSNWLVNYCAYINGVRDRFLQRDRVTDTDFEVVRAFEDQRKVFQWRGDVFGRRSKLNWIPIIPAPGVNVYDKETRNSKLGSTGEVVPYQYGTAESASRLRAAKLETTFRRLACIKPLYAIQILFFPILEAPLQSQGVPHVPVADGRRSQLDDRKAVSFPRRKNVCIDIYIRMQILPIEMFLLDASVVRPKFQHILLCRLRDPRNICQRHPEFFGRIARP